jgi:hypothetical protein
MTGKTIWSLAGTLLLGGVTAAQSPPAPPTPVPAPRISVSRPVPAPSPVMPRFAIPEGEFVWADDEQSSPARDKAREEQERARAQRIREQEEKLYDAAEVALEEGEYAEAAQLFAQVAGMKGRKRDAALYWQAYAQFKLGLKAEALSTLAALKAQHASSPYLKDARALEIEVQQSAGQTVNPEQLSEDEELKMLALQGCMQSDPGRCLPLLDMFLKQSRSLKLKKHALFVLAQSANPQSLEILAHYARTETSPELQRQAIEYLGLFGGAPARQTLSEIYASTTSVEVKRRILRSFMLAGERSRLLNAAKGENEAELRAEAVRLLGLTGARAELWQLYQTEASVDVREGILQALFLSGDVERVTELAKAEKDPKLRLQAIRNLGLMGHKNPEAIGTTLVSIYSSAPDKETREAVINALFFQGSARALIQLARQEKDAALKKEIVHKLSLMKSKEAADFLMELLSK